MKKRIHVNQHVIKANRKSGASDPPLTVKTYCANHRARSVQVQGPSQIIYSPEKPLDCGATVWIETVAPVLLDGKVAL